MSPEILVNTRSDDKRFERARWDYAHPNNLDLEHRVQGCPIVAIDREQNDSLIELQLVDWPDHPIQSPPQPGCMGAQK